MMNKLRIKTILLLVFLLTIPCYAYQNTQDQKPWDNGRLVISENSRFLQHENGKPFFWLADTGLLLFEKLNRDEVQTYLEDRKKKDLM
jgi:hypothetical protein